MSEPRRIQRKRTKGYRLPPNTVYVGRPSKWGNPWQVEDSGRNEYQMGMQIPGRRWEVFFYGLSKQEAMAEAYACYSAHMSMRDTQYLPPREEIIRDLRGKNLACWCPLTDAQGNHVPCHADVLLEIANQDQEESK